MNVKRWLLYKEDIEYQGNNHANLENNYEECSKKYIGYFLFIYFHIL